jgi:hypothetical protein
MPTSKEKKSCHVVVSDEKDKIKNELQYGFLKLFDIAFIIFCMHFQKQLKW